MIHFDLPKDQSSIIKVIGVGGGGSNAVNHMFSQNIDGVNFIICNTDAQAIAQSSVPNKIQLGPHLTQGLGAGANPKVGREATEESLEEIKRILEVNTKMAFITAGMGGGTGTGGAPIIAKICKDLGILTVGIVTTPFSYEGRKRIAQAEEGIALLKDHVDTLLVISNDKLRHQFGNLKMKEAFNKADDILATAAKCITDVINSTGQINVDFADVCTVMSNGGVAILGSGAANGEDRAQAAVEAAMASPLLNDNDIRGAKWILININSAEGDHEFTMDEVEVIQNHILSQAGDDTDVILGLGYDSTLEDKISITLIATGFQHKDPFAKDVVVDETSIAPKEEKVVMHLEMPSNKPVASAPVQQANELVQPTLQFTDSSIQAKMQQAEEEKKAIDPMMPTLVDNSASVEVLSKNTGDNLLVSQPQIDLPSSKPAVQFDESLFVSPTNQNASNTSQPSSGNGFLVKPTQIYASAEPKESTVSKEEPLQNFTQPTQQDEAEMELKLVVKEPSSTAEPISNAGQTSEPLISKNVEEPAMQDDADELRRRAQERLAKLRNLSYNINASDPTNEFESVPAYLRRNMEMHNQIANVENFYSNLTVKSDDNNLGEINTINNFLDGKKPD
jgi:cell division protein FtsZ